MIPAAPGDSSLFGIGFDAGVLARSSFGLNGSMVLQDLNTNTGQPRPKLDLGNRVYMAKMADRSRGLPGARRRLGSISTPAWRRPSTKGCSRSERAEASSLTASASFLGLRRELLSGRLGRGHGDPHRRHPPSGRRLPDDFQLPLRRPRRSRAPLSATRPARPNPYAPNIQKLEEKKKDLDAQAKESETHSQISEQNLDVLEKRVRETEDQYRELQKKNEETQFGIKSPRSRTPRKKRCRASRR